MNKVRMSLRVLIVSSVFFMISFLQGQYIIEQIEYKLPLSYELLPQDTEFASSTEEAKFFLNLPETKIKEAAQREGKEIKEQKSITYIDGDNVAVDIESEDGKTTIILNSASGMIYYVIWPGKRVFEMSKKDMEEMQKTTEAATQKMLEQLPPEMREQAKTAMEEEKKHKKSNRQLVATGKKAKKYGFDCEQYIMEGDEDVIMLWASDDVQGLAQKTQALSEKLSSIFPDEDEQEKDEWELIPGKIPVEVRTFRMDPMDGPTINIEAITKINKTKPAANKFIPPGKAEGFTRSSMKEMMMQMMDNSGEER